MSRNMMAWPLNRRGLLAHVYRPVRSCSRPEIQDESQHGEVVDLHRPIGSSLI
jgi:hypothetical protein